MVMTYDNGNWRINNMAQVSAHEIGHLFWALDEYAEAGQDHSYTTRSGYYNVQNTNAAYNRPANAGAQVSSIMAGANLQSSAFSNYTSSISSLEMIGWRDTDGNGILDVLDTPLTMKNTAGNFDLQTRTFTFTGTSSVTALPNQNTQATKDLRNDITLNTVDKLQYKLDGGDWVTLDTFYGGTTNVRVGTTVTLADISTGQHTIVFRTICERTGVVSAEKSFNVNTAVANPVKPSVRKTSTITTVTLTWAANTRNAYYEVTCAALPPGATITLSNTGAVIKGLTPNMSYKFSIVAKNADGKSVAPVSITAKTQKYAAVGRLRSVSAEQTLTSITLAWRHSPVPETTGYNVLVFDSGGIKFIREIPVAGTEIKTTIMGLEAATRYTFVVQAVSSTLGVTSARAKIKASTARYTAVQRLQKAAATPDSVTLTWTDSKTTLPDADDIRYEIRWIDGGKEMSKSFEFAPATISGLEPYKRYKFVVREIATVNGKELTSLAAAVSVMTARLV